MALTKRQRARVFRGVQYGIGLLIVVIFALTANWANLKNAFFNVDVALSMFPRIITVGLYNTVIYTALGFSVGLVLGLVLALMRLSTVRVYRGLAIAYIEFFRGLPALLVLIAVGYGVPLAFPGTIFDKYTALAIGLGIVASAYMAETFRAGIQAVPAGQVEAARSLGLSSGRTTSFVVIPQAFKIILPPLTNELIALTKDSSLALFLGSTIAEQELTQMGRIALNTSKSLTPVVVAGFCYLIITLPLGYLSRYLERRTGGAKISTTPESISVGGPA
ncbi:amino acid ABC transporter permease [Actinophytocola sp.]|uniref:amino acid ABC transporter permease n=1 Tax=Actinophytocola sp. TaxID=1872138 RepID=UPI002D7F69DD|nr:amino acid ABC transporter permease [Actinophytocola sp.]HET9144289.1 amino acid ABC transporter permease [Actinophytocola sp.]